MNTANKITFSRLIFIPIIMFLYLAEFIPYGKLIAMVLFIVASLTDMLDGHVARKYNMVTNLGKFMDPIADKVLVMAGLMLIFADNILPDLLLILTATIMFARDYIIDSLRQIGASRGKIIAAAKSGKIKAFMLDVAIIFAMLIGANAQSFNITGVIYNVSITLTYAVFGIAVILVIYSLFEYLIKNKSVFQGE